MIGSNLDLDLVFGFLSCTTGAGRWRSSVLGAPSRTSTRTTSSIGPLCGHYCIRLQILLPHLTPSSNPGKQMPGMKPTYLHNLWGITSSFICSSSTFRYNSTQPLHAFMRMSSMDSVIVIRRQARDQNRPEGGGVLDESIEKNVSA